MPLDIKQTVTDTIIEQIEAGTPPWRKPWTGDRSGASFPLRHNGEPYRGVNILVLWCSAMKHGFNSDRWMTFRQAKELGGSVRKGEKSTKTVYYGTYERDVDGETETQTSRFAKGFSVFNADQIDGLPEDYYTTPTPPKDLGTETIPELEAFFQRTGAKIITSDAPRAYYSPSLDHIHMPPIATFFDANGYFATLAHETTHWTGAEKRLGRIKKFQDRAAYAFEELVAEIGACFLSLQLGLTPDFEQSAAYVESWLKALKSEKDMIFRASAEAQKAVDFINDAARETANAA